MLTAAVYLSPVLVVVVVISLLLRFLDDCDEGPMHLQDCNVIAFLTLPCQLIMCCNDSAWLRCDISLS